MKKLYFVLFFILFMFSSKAQIITFSDNVFKSKLVESSSDNFIARNLSGDYFAIDANNNNQIEVAEALQVGFLDIDNASISSLNGIENFTNLVSLNCENNQIQSLDVSSLLSLTFLNCNNNLISNLNVNGLTELQNLYCQFNQISTLNLSELINILNVDCSYNQLSSLNLNNTIAIEVLNCSNNQLAVLDLTDLINLKSIDCSYNVIVSLNTSGLTSLESLNCINNLMTSLAINGLINFNNLDCSNNQLSALNLDDLLSLNNLNCNYNLLPLINLSSLINLKNLNCTNNQITSLNLNGLSQLENLFCGNNQIATIDLSGLSQLITLNCNNNQILNLDLSSLTSLKYFYCNTNLIASLNANNLNTLLVLSCSNNQITTLNLLNTNNLQSLYCDDNQIVTLDLKDLINLQNLFCSNNQLTSLFIKNGSFESNLQFSGNENLEFICADETQIYYVQDEINNNNYTNCHVNTYCSFVPGGDFYVVQGNSKFDGNNNGCNTLDSNYPNLQLSFSDGSITENLFPNASGNFIKSVKSGSFTVAPILENPTYFSISPATFTIDFPQVVSPFNQDFCVTAAGNHADLEISIFPLKSLIPGLDATYKIVYKNKGTSSQSGSINFTFNDAVLDVVNANPTITSQSSNTLNWSFSNLVPLETKTILVTLNANSSSENPSLNAGQTLVFNASISGSSSDEMPSDNTISLRQTVVNSAEINTKICVEGSTISLAQVGEYVHYLIRFKNSGTAIAQNVVVKDVLDTSKFDMATLVPIDGSHAFETRISNLNETEFIFENINLPFDTSNNDGFVAFKIKTVPNLVLGDTFSNTATIYFDYNAPINSNTSVANVQALGNEVFELVDDDFQVYPNPVNDVLHFNSDNNHIVNSISIFNSMGQLLQVVTNPISKSIDVSQLKKGVYFLSIATENKTASIKFIKE